MLLERLVGWVRRDEVHALVGQRAEPLHAVAYVDSEPFVGAEHVAVEEGEVHSAPQRFLIILREHFLHGITLMTAEDANCSHDPMVLMDGLLHAQMSSTTLDVTRFTVAPLTTSPGCGML